MSIHAALANSDDKADIAARYDRYVKLVVRNGGIPDDPDTWAHRECGGHSEPRENTLAPFPQPECTNEERLRIRDAFLMLMVPEGHGSFEERARYGVLKIGEVK